MSDVWDRAMQVIAGRRAILATLALAWLWLPGLVQSALSLAASGPEGEPAPATGAGLALVLVGLVAAVAAMIGHLALIAVASDPAVSRGQAVAIALRRLGPYLGIVVLMMAVLALLAAPLGVAMVSAYPSMAAMRAGTPPQLTAGIALFVSLYGLAALVLLVWAEARLLSILAPVVVNERLGLGSLARAVRLTRGLTWRIVGVALLAVVVALVALIATRSVVGVALRLLLGAEGQATALFLTGAVVSLLGCVIAVVAAAFTAQLYVAVRDGGTRREAGPRA